MSTKTTVFAYYSSEPGGELDNAVRKAFGRSFSGSGTWLDSGQRDSSGSGSNKAMDRVVAKLNRIKDVQVEVHR